MSCTAVRENCGSDALVAVKQYEMILVVDDEPADLNMMRDILVQAGYSVVTAPDPYAALTLYQRHQGELYLLITDVAMSPINGCELAEKLTDLNKALSVIFVSGYSGAQALQYKRRYQTPIAFLMKPFTSEQLLAQVRESPEPRKARTASSQQGEF